MEHDRPYQTYSWHQSHDQATVILMVPYETVEEDMVIVIERNYIVVGMAGRSPIMKGRLYGNIDVTNSLWQLEPQSSRLLSRGRTISTTSSASTPSSYAFISDPEISSSFAASLESGHASDAEDFVASSPPISSPASGSADDRALPQHHRRHINPPSITSRPVSPGHAFRSMTSSYSSLDSVHSSYSGRLLTIHLEKETSIIWPSLIVGPVPESLSPYVFNQVVFDNSHELEHRYNMDPTSLVLIALELFDIRKDKDEAFEYFLRAWHQARAPSATMRLVAHYLPLQVSFEIDDAVAEPVRGTAAYYLQCIGGAGGLAQLYLEAGMLHLEGAASELLALSSSSLSSIRVPPQSQSGETGMAAWKRDRQSAERYFDRARALQPNLEIPSLPPDAGEFITSTDSSQELEMPSIEIRPASPAGGRSGNSYNVGSDTPSVRKLRKENMLFSDRDEKVDDFDNAWYLYIPGLVGAGTALLVVGVVGALSLSTWRRSQGS